MDKEDCKFDLEKLSTNIVGLFHPNENGRIRYEVITDYLEENVDEKDRYSGYTDDMMTAEGYIYFDRVYEFDYAEIGTVYLKCEGENVFDKDPIKVYHNEIGDLGYVPFIDKLKVKEIMDNHCLFLTEIVFEGGNYKELNEITKKIVHVIDNFKIRLNLYYEKNKKRDCR
ncbi:MAG: hypothetical protein Q4A42_05200 [Tissierellia bacterium]|nr:hypothetical protein [Tissierellia bacterium]